VPASTRILAAPKWAGLPSDRPARNPFQTGSPRSLPKISPFSTGTATHSTCRPGTQRLARTELYENQAFAIEDYALALQFHPEVTESGLGRWYGGHTCELN